MTEDTRSTRAKELILATLIGFSVGGTLVFLNPADKGQIQKDTCKAAVEEVTKKKDEEKTQLQQGYEKSLGEYKQKFELLQKRAGDADVLLETTKRAHAADKEKLTELENKVKDTLAQVEQYKKNKDEGKTSPSLSDVTYERVNNQYESISFVMHALTSEQVTALETTLDKVFHKLNKKRTNQQLIYARDLVDPECVSNGPWVKADIWEEDKGYAIKIATSLPGNKEVKLVEVLEKNCVGLPFSKLRNSIK